MGSDLAQSGLTRRCSVRGLAWAAFLDDQSALPSLVVRRTYR